MKSFEGKTAVITGGASGIGLEFAEKCAELRMNIVLADVEASALQSAVTYFEDRQQPVHGVLTNVLQKAAIENLKQEAIDRFGKVHLLFNNAGVDNGGPQVPVWELSDVDWDWVMGVNFYGVLYGLQTFVPHMIEHGEECHIVNTASIAAFIPGGGPYGVSKYGVVTLSEALIQDLASRKLNIGASVLCPGWVNTKIGDAERNRPENLANNRNPDKQGLGLNQLLSGSKSPAELASQVFEAITANKFYILPHSGWDQMIADHAQAIVAREGVYKFDVLAQTQRGIRGEDV